MAAIMTSVGNAYGRIQSRLSVVCTMQPLPVPCRQEHLMMARLAKHSGSPFEQAIAGISEDNG
jgi:hypothetical protein